MTQDELQAIRERVNKATPGPWIAKNEGAGSTGVLWATIDIESYGTYVQFISRLHKPDAEFIAHAREDVPKLLDKVDELTKDARNIANWNHRIRKENDRLNDEVERLRGALEWYAQASVYEKSPMSGSNFVTLDGGRRARQALEGETV